MPQKAPKSGNRAGIELDIRHIAPGRSAHANTFAIERIGNILLLHFGLVDDRGMLRSRLHISMDMQDVGKAWNTAKEYLEKVSDDAQDETEWQSQPDKFRHLGECDITAVRLVNMARSDQYAELLFSPFAVWTVLKLREAGDQDAALPIGDLTLVLCPLGMQRQFLLALATQLQPEQQGPP